MKPTLLVMAAGMGSRYGGLKQLDGVGPNGETIMDYSIYDALFAGILKKNSVRRYYLNMSTLSPQRLFSKKLISSLIPLFARKGV